MDEAQEPTLLWWVSLLRLRTSHTRVMPAHKSLNVRIRHNFISKRPFARRLLIAAACSVIDAIICGWIFFFIYRAGLPPDDGAHGQGLWIFIDPVIWYFMFPCATVGGTVGFLVWLACLRRLDPVICACILGFTTVVCMSFLTLYGFWRYCNGFYGILGVPLGLITGTVLCRRLHQEKSVSGGRS
jgi:hypothetical protein